MYPLEPADPNHRDIVSTQCSVKLTWDPLDVRFPERPDDDRAFGAVRQIVAGFSQIAGGLATLRNVDGGKHGSIEERIATPTLA